MDKEKLKEGYNAYARFRGLGNDTIRVYLGEISEFLDFCQEKGKEPEAIGKHDMQEYIVRLRDRGLTNDTLRYYLAAVSSFNEFLNYEEKTEVNIIDVMRKHFKSYKNDGERHSHKLISIPEAIKMLGYCIDIRDKAILLTLLKTGIRRSELVSLDVSDVNFNDGSILLKPTCKRSNRKVFFDDECARILKRWINLRNERADPSNPALFISNPKARASKALVHQVIQRVAIKAKLHNKDSKMMEDHFSAHCCRHWNNTHLYYKGMPIEYIQWLRGDHMSKQAVNTYLHFNPETIKARYLECIPQLGVR